MPEKIGAFLSKLAARTGVDITTPEFVEFAKSTVEIPDSVVAQFDAARFYTPDGAKNDPELKRMFFGQALNGFDTRMAGLMDELQVPEEIRAAVNAEPKSIEKAAAFVKAIKALESQKVGATAGERASLQERINALQAEKANEVQKVKDEFAIKETGYKSRFLKMEVDGKIKNKKLDTSQHDLGTMTELANLKLSKALTEKGAKIVEINDTFVLKRADDETLDYYENNQAVTLDSFIDQVLAANKLLAVNEPTTAPVNYPNGPRHLPPPPAPPNGGQPQPSAGFFSRLEQAKADLAANSQGV